MSFGAHRQSRRPAAYFKLSNIHTNTFQASRIGDAPKNQGPRPHRGQHPSLIPGGHQKRGF